ncbi:hypothetical protein [Zophobihabitans entericus]|uniref:Phosphoadenosine phosphosulphate reductase domain-containing protein n=1 Tax=Zophobihabitans entericus TaxID=1635327 RepID=A0A6G9IEL2_9GAMM|nr:hypothetical protein [Zophobihabitans entericus]QIQ22134.1 hypothetical protein IPMB12_10835 [Zophobihabitans entericus]
MTLIQRNFKHDPTRFNVLSSGGGTQSIAIICLIHAKKLPKPDCIVMIDTEREASNALNYQRQYMMPMCHEIGLDYYIVEKSLISPIDLIYPKNGTVLPGYHSEFNGRNKSGHCKGKQPGYCSVKWKSDVFQKFLNMQYGERYLTKRGVNIWLGMSFDEPKRIKTILGKWQRKYPLFEMMITRETAIKLVEDYGLPTPPRSACWMCPNRSDAEWLWMKDNVPEDFKKACEHEKELQQDFPHLWLTRYGVPLDKAPFLSQDNMTNLTQFCDTGMCFS